MTFTVGIYRAGPDPSDGWVWVVRSGDDQVMADGREPSWPEALAEVDQVMTLALHDAVTMPAMVYRPLEA